MICITNARQHQEFRGIDRRGRNNHFHFGGNNLARPLNAGTDPMCAALCDFNFFRQSFDQLHAARFQCWAQIGLGRGPSFPVVGGLLHRAKALLLLPVIICGCLVPRLHTCLDKGGHQGIVTLAPCHMQRTVFSTPFGITAMSRRCPTFLA